MAVPTRRGACRLPRESFPRDPRRGGRLPPRTTAPVPNRPSSDERSGRWRNVAVHTEQVARVVFGLDASEAFVVLPVGAGGPSGVVLGQLEVDVVPAGREGPDSLPAVPYRRHDFLPPC